LARVAGFPGGGIRGGHHHDRKGGLALLDGKRIGGSPCVGLGRRRHQGLQRCTGCKSQGGSEAGELGPPHWRRTQGWGRARGRGGIGPSRGAGQGRDVLQGGKAEGTQHRDVGGSPAAVEGPQVEGILKQLAAWHPGAGKHKLHELCSKEYLRYVEITEDPRRQPKDSWAAAGRLADRRENEADRERNRAAEARERQAESLECQRQSFAQLRRSALHSARVQEFVSRLQAEKIQIS